MDPLDFYEFAKEMRALACKYAEASKRTIVSRIYYAIFLMVRDELNRSLVGSSIKSLYDSVSQRGPIHTMVVQALGKIGDGHMEGILRHMQRRREGADYKMLKIADWESEIADIILEAEEILQNKSNLQPGFSEESYEIEQLITFWHSKIATSP